jgi:predicted outer membrane repeat protein
VYRDHPKAVAPRVFLTTSVLVGIVSSAMATQVLSQAGASKVLTVTNCDGGRVGSGTEGSLSYVVRKADEKSGANPHFSGTIDVTVHCPASAPVRPSKTLLINSNIAIVGPGSTRFVVSGHGAIELFSVDAGITASLSGLTIEDGLSSGSGSGIYNIGTLTVSDSVFVNNQGSAAGDGAVIANGGALDVVDSTFESNVGAPAIEGGGPHITVSGSTFMNNSAPDQTGGAIDSQGAMSISDSTFVGNSAGFGAGVYSAPGEGVSGSIVNSTFTDNTASAWGGAIANIAGTMDITNSTIVDNAAQSGEGGGIDIGGSSAPTTASAIILADNSDGGNCNVVANGYLLTDGGFNLSDEGPSGSCGLTQSSDVLMANPELGPLQSNGGPTETMALSPGSPAIDQVSIAALCPATDQRGVARSVPCDIGAYDTDG